MNERNIFHVTSQDYRKAGANDLIQLHGAHGNNDLFVPRYLLEIVVSAIVLHETLHIGGPTGSGKTALIEALCDVPENFLAIHEHMKLPGEPKPVRCWPVPVSSIDSPSEVYHLRSIAPDRGTYFENSAIFNALEEAQSPEVKEQFYCTVWFKELGRVGEAVQGALVDVITQGRIAHPSRGSISTDGVAFLADSNYQAQDVAVHTLATFDESLKRRFRYNTTVMYQSPAVESIILRHICSDEGIAYDEEVLAGIVKLGGKVREAKAAGKLVSLPPPTISAYLSILKIVRILPGLELRTLLENSILGNATNDDRKLFPALYHDTFASAPVEDVHFAIGEDLL